MTEQTRVRLKEALAGSLTTRASVTSVIVELRKAVETFTGKYDALSFFCDWALHHKLTQTKAMHILSEVDAVVDSHFTQHKLPDLQMRRLRPIFDFSKFRDEVVLFLGENQLPATLPGDLFRWSSFLSEYVAIVSEAPLEYAGSKKLALKRINNIRVKRSDRALPTDAIGPEDRFLFGVRWMFQRGDKALMSTGYSFVAPGHPTHTLHSVLRRDPVTAQVSPIPRETNLLWEATPTSTETTIGHFLVPAKNKDDPWPW